MAALGRAVKTATRTRSRGAGEQLAPGRARSEMLCDPSSSGNPGDA